MKEKNKDSIKVHSTNRVEITGILKESFKEETSSGIKIKPILISHILGNGELRDYNVALLGKARKKWNNKTIRIGSYIHLIGELLLNSEDELLIIAHRVKKIAGK